MEHVNNVEIAVACRVRQWILENKDRAKQEGFTTKSVSDELGGDHAFYKKVSAALSKLATTDALGRRWDGASRSYVYSLRNAKALDTKMRSAPDYHTRVLTKAPKPWKIDKGEQPKTILLGPGSVEIPEGGMPPVVIEEVREALKGVTAIISEPTLADGVLESAIALEKEGPSRPLGLRLMEQALEVMRRAK